MKLTAKDGLVLAFLGWTKEKVKRVAKANGVTVGFVMRELRQDVRWKQSQGVKSK